VSGAKTGGMREPLAPTQRPILQSEGKPGGRHPVSWYRTRVERDLARWQSAGWVNEAGATAIRADLAARKSTFGAAGIFAILGAVLFGFAVISFVAANWNAMGKLARLLLLLAALWGCYGGAAYLFARRLDVFAHAAVLGGIAVFGAGIALIAQMYHMDAHPPDGLLAWALGALLAAVLVRSNAALGAAFVLLAAWTYLERGLGSGPHWAFLALWAVAACVTAWLRWRPGLHLAALSLVLWVVPLGYLLLDHRNAHWLNAVIGAGFALSAVAVHAAARSAPAIERYSGALRVIFAYGSAVAFVGLFAMQFFDDGFGWSRQPLGELAAVAAVTLVLLIAAMYWALATDNRGALWIGYIAFVVEIFALYIKMLGTLLNTSLFFLVAALIVSALAWAAYRLHQRQAPAKEATA